MVKVVVFLAAAAGALNFGSKPTTGGTTPAAFKPAFGNPAQIAQRAAARLAKQEECKKDLMASDPNFEAEYEKEQRGELPADADGAAAVLDAPLRQDAAERAAGAHGVG